MVSRPTGWRELDKSDESAGKGAGLLHADDATETTTWDGPLDGWTDDSEFEGSLARLGDGVL
jgi:hypothetical protein